MKFEKMSQATHKKKGRTCNHGVDHMERYFCDLGLKEVFGSCYGED